MLPLPNALQKVFTPFACLFTKPTWQKAQVLLVGAVLTPRKRTVTAALRVLGLAQQRDFATYHQVLNRASWSAFKASRILLGLLLSAFDTGGALVFGIDETLERRWGKKIKAKGIYRDAVDQPDVARAGSLGPARLGAAGSHSLSSLGAILPRTRYPAQETH
jgi:hypothetical protein